MTTPINPDWHPDFIAELNRLATRWKISVEIVAESWKQYEASCTDQSAVLFEFERWVDRGVYRELIERTVRKQHEARVRRSRKP